MPTHLSRSVSSPRSPAPRHRRPAIPALALLLGAGVPACSGMDDPMAPAMPGWDRTLPPSATLGPAQATRGLRVVRGIIHLHSTFSHDACDYTPWPGGKPDATCGQHLRQGLCQTRQDFAMLTDHGSMMADNPWPDLFIRQGADQAMMDGADLIGSQLACDDTTGMAGQRVVLTVGGENALMPVGLHRQLADTADARHAAMEAETPEAVAAFHQAGGAVFVPHGESRAPDLLHTLAAAGLDGMEVYNLHANIDPNIRNDWLGLPPLGAVQGLVPWLEGSAPEEGGPQPDMALLGFLEENQNQVGKYDVLLGAGFHLLPIFGSDSHENAVKQLLSDNERGDSYRRLMRWFSNHLLVPAATAQTGLTPADLLTAIQKGRGYGAFEIFGPPVGLDYRALPVSGALAEMGDTVKGPATLVLTAPQVTLPPGVSADNAPVLRLRILYDAPQATAPVEVASLTLSGSDGELRHDVSAPGAYRAEVRIVPRHLLPLLGDEGVMNGAKYAHEYPYIYTSPIYVSP